MRTRFIAPLLAVMVPIALVSPARAAAQSGEDIAGYIALVFTPPGGLVPLPPPATSARGSAFVMRYGNLDGDGGSLHNFSLGGDIALQRGRLGLTLGGTACDGCDGNIMVGVDYTGVLTQNVVSIALRPAFGFSKPLEGSGTALSLGLSLPVGVELSGATGPVFTPFIVPGFGYGRLSGDDDSEGSVRPMLGGGFSVAGRQSNFAVHVGFQKVFIEDGDTTLGLGLSFGRRAPASGP